MKGHAETGRVCAVCTWLAIGWSLQFFVGIGVDVHRTRHAGCSCGARCSRCLLCSASSAHSTCCTCHTCRTSYLTRIMPYVQHGRRALPGDLCAPQQPPQPMGVHRQRSAGAWGLRRHFNFPKPLWILGIPSWHHESRDPTVRMMHRTCFHSAPRAATPCCCRALPSCIWVQRLPLETLYLSAKVAS